MAGDCIHHSVDHHWSPYIEGPAVARDAADGLELVRRVIIPNDFSGIGSVGAQVSVQGAREDHTRNPGHRRRLPWTAGGLVAAPGRWGPPHLAPVIDTIRHHPSAFAGVYSNLALARGRGQEL